MRSICILPKEIEPNMQKSIKSIRELILYNSNNAELLQKEKQ